MNSHISVDGSRKLRVIRSKYNRLDVVRWGEGLNLRSAQGSYGFYHPRILFTGYSWDCLSLAPSFSFRQRVERVLVLGLGGGTVLRQCHRLYQQAWIDVVEVDAEVIATAKQLFHLPSERVRLVCADAADYVLHCHQRYDAVLEDVWLSMPATKPLLASHNYASDVARLLEPRGIYASNVLAAGRNAELMKAATRLRGTFRSILSLRAALGPTAVLVAGHRLRSRRSAFARLGPAPKGLISTLQVQTFPELGSKEGCHAADRSHL